MDLALIITRLDTTATTLDLVAGTMDLATVVNAPKRKPAGYVIPLSETAGPNTLGSGATSQEVVEHFGVLLAVSNLRDARGEQANADLETVRLDVRAALLGWAPASTHDPIIFTGGRVMQINQQVIWWQDEFSTARLIRST